MIWTIDVWKNNDEYARLVSTSKTETNNTNIVKLICVALSKEFNKSNNHHISISTEVKIFSEEQNDEFELGLSDWKEEKEEVGLSCDVFPWIDEEQFDQDVKRIIGL